VWSLGLALALVSLTQPAFSLDVNEDLNNSNCELNGNCPSQHSGPESEESPGLADEDGMFMTDQSGSSFAAMADSHRFDGIKRTQALIANSEFDKAAQVLTDELYHAYYTRDEVKNPDEPEVVVRTWLCTLVELPMFNHFARVYVQSEDVMEYVFSAVYCLRQLGQV
jgi:hypothetical protein